MNMICRADQKLLIIAIFGQKCFMCSSMGRAWVWG